MSENFDMNNNEVEKSEINDFGDDFEEINHDKKKIQALLDEAVKGLKLKYFFQCIQLLNYFYLII